MTFQHAQVMVRETDAALVDRVAEALRALTDGDLKMVGASSTLAADVLATAAAKVARERVESRGYEQQRADIQRELDQMRARLAAVEADLAEARRDRSLDEWVKEQRVNALRAEQSELRGRLSGHERALREVTALVHS